MGSFPMRFDVVRHKLGDDGVKAFKNTCVGHFLDVKSMTFCSGIVHNFLVRVLECDDPDVLEFNFRRIGLRFDRNAFNLVSGLKFSQFPSFLEMRDLSDTLWDKYFGVRGTLKQKEFMTKFERYSFDKMEVEDNVKVCMFYLLEAVLLAGDKRKSVSCDHFKIIQNPKLCERYPWGSLSYDVTIKSLRSVVNHSNTSNTFSLSGFPIAFQYHVHNQLHLTAQEKKEAYITYFFRTIAYRSYDGPPSMVEDVDDTTVDPPLEQVQPDHRTPATTASTSHAPHLVIAPYATSKDVTRLENKLDYLNRKVKLIMQHLGIERCSSFNRPARWFPYCRYRSRRYAGWGSPTVYTDPGESAWGSHSRQGDTIEPSEHSIVVHSGSLRTSRPQLALMATTSGPKFKRFVKRVTWYRQVLKKSAVLSSPFTPLQNLDTSRHPPLVNSSTSTRDIPTLMYDPYRAVEENHRTLLMNFLDDSSRPSHGVDIIVLNESSFHTILTSVAWLHSDKRIHDHRDIFTERVAIVNVFFWESFYYRFKAHAPVMQKKYIHLSERPLIPSRDWTLDMNNDTMTNYVKGISPLLSFSWKNVDRVYVPVNNEDKYWLPAKVDLVPTCHNRMTRAIVQVRFQTCNAELLGVLFSYLLATSGFYDERPELAFNGTPILDAFSMSRIDTALCPQQSSSLGDCGMFMLLCINYLSAGRTLDYSLDMIEFFREKYVVGLYNNEFTL
ncbi:hypothetical protein FNV43_RR15505 [Rhamnella rubrinervis]|uniref:Ubiquitin-like protease family profile domain-containing protein n=1 Tax=Rhamnella rubrinervis TaxID=2594499 RepID=A0A8K0E3J0_9ROSA|nr:hypothetical protein FNV43_RR15505 [Rhamnella rubrinervis]